MINLLLGQPGGGKSYEAVAYHIIPAITAGRKVITNLSVNVDIFEAFFPGAKDLIEIRNPTLGEHGVVRPFSRVEHYGDAWRDAESGAGCLYVIDECHLALPRVGTALAVEEWYSLHRHEGADVLLITQSYGKISQAVRDLVQVVYRCKKATAFGTNDRYIRKVQDGLRGEVVNTSFRTYEPKFFQFYKSHTKSNKAVQELAANDITPLWKRWPFIGFGICVILVIGMSIFQTTKDKKAKYPPVKPVQHVEQAAPLSSVAQSPIQTAPAEPLITAQPRGPDRKMHPYDGFSFHLVGTLKAKKYGSDGLEHEYLAGFVSISQAGQSVRQVSFSDLSEAGYDITYISPSAISLAYKGLDLGYVITDLPRVSLQPVDGITKAGK